MRILNSNLQHFISFFFDIASFFTCATSCTHFVHFLFNIILQFYQTFFIIHKYNTSIKSNCFCRFFIIGFERKFKLPPFFIIQTNQITYLEKKMCPPHLFSLPIRCAKIAIYVRLASLLVEHNIYGYFYRAYACDEQECKALCESHTSYLTISIRRKPVMSKSAKRSANRIASTTLFLA